MAKIWIVEDDPSIGTLIEMAMKKDGHQTRRFASAEAMERGMSASEELPDLMLLDLMLRAKNGFTVIEEWKSGHRTRRIPIIIISARSMENDKVRGLELGAEDYITKPFGVRELQARVHAALRRLNAHRRETLSLGELSLVPESREVFVGETRIELTVMEFDLLFYLACRPGSTVKRSELLREVWGYAGGDDLSRTVDSHIKTLRLKLGDNAQDPRFIQTVRGTGYRLIAGTSL